MRLPQAEREESEQLHSEMPPRKRPDSLPMRGQDSAAHGRPIGSVHTPPPIHPFLLQPLQPCKPVELPVGTKFNPSTSHPTSWSLSFVPLLRGT